MLIEVKRVLFFPAIVRRVARRKSIWKAWENILRRHEGGVNCWVVVGDLNMGNRERVLIAPAVSIYLRQQNKCYPSKLHSILAVANLLAHNNISQICYCGQISLQSAAVKCSLC